MHLGHIEAVRWRSFRVDLRSPFRSANEVLGVREGLIVTVETSAGAVGIGEASALPGFGGGSLAETSGALARMALAVVGKAPPDAWALGSPLPGVSRGSAAAATCGVETALADLLARAQELPLAAWLARQAGIEPPRLPCDLPVNAVIDAADPDGAAAAAMIAVARGYQTIKLKVGTGVAADLARVAAVRAAIGPDLALRVDANGGWNFEDAATFFCDRATTTLALCEQPLSPADDQAFAATAALRRLSPAPLAADESCRSLSDLEAILAANAADAVIVKPMVTGLRPALAILARARAAGLPAIVTTTFDSGVGTALATHLAALLPEPRPACGLSTIEHLSESLVIGLSDISAGQLRLTDAPGLGVDLDWVALERCAGPIAGEVRA